MLTSRVALLSSGLDPEVASYAAAISANGGSVSQTWLRNVNTFVRGCKGDGIWDSLLDVGLLCGADNLSGALVKLKTPSGVSRILTNNNFVSGDYVASGSTAGLLGNGINKNLQPGINLSVIASILSVHLSVYNTVASSSGNRIAIGSYSAAASSAFIRTRENFDASDFSLGSIGGGSNGSRIGITCGTITGGNTLGFSNGVQVHSRATSGAIPNENIRVFGVEEGGAESTYNGKITFYSAGTGLTASQAAALSTRVNDLMRTIGANQY